VTSGKSSVIKSIFTKLAPAQVARGGYFGAVRSHGDRGPIPKDVGGIPHLAQRLSREASTDKNCRQQEIIRPGRGEGKLIFF
jgi:hypothetical protein